MEDGGVGTWPTRPDGGVGQCGVSPIEKRLEGASDAALLTEKRSSKALQSNRGGGVGSGSAALEVPPKSEDVGVGSPSKGGVLRCAAAGCSPAGG
eukprot:4382645-Prymnesium_polylepis.1